MPLQLRDSFLADHLGRKVLVHAQTRAVAASAIQVMLFQLSHIANSVTALEASQWQYLDNKVRGCDEADERRGTIDGARP